MTLSWIAPFSLNIPRIDPDILYCVSLESVDSSSLPQHKCDIEETSFTFDMSERPYGKYWVTVTPHNIVGKGKSNKLIAAWEEGQ